MGFFLGLSILFLESVLASMHPFCYYLLIHEVFLVLSALVILNEESIINSTITLYDQEFNRPLTCSIVAI
jgi:hypothetical protein